MATLFGITLNVSQQTIYTANNVSGFRLTIQATNGLNMDNNIFRFSRKTYNYITGAQQDVFSGVCSPEQLSSVPIGTPNTNDPNQYTRSDTVDLVIQSRDLANKTLTAIQGDVNALVNALKIQSTLSAPQVIRIGDS